MIILQENNGAEFEDIGTFAQECCAKEYAKIYYKNKNAAFINGIGAAPAAANLSGELRIIERKEKVTWEQTDGDRQFWAL